MPRTFDKSHEFLGTAFAPKMECADSYVGRIRAQPGLCTWGYRARIRATRSFKQSPCRLDEKSDGRTAPRYEFSCDGRANIIHRRQREEVLDMLLWGKCTKSRIWNDHRYGARRRPRKGVHSQARRHLPLLPRGGRYLPFSRAKLGTFGTKRGTGSCDPWDQQLSGSHVRRVLENHNIRTPSLRSPARPVRYVFWRLNTHTYSPDNGAGAVSPKFVLAKEGTDGLAVGRGCWRWRRAAGKQRQGKALASSRPTLSVSSLPRGDVRSYVGRRRVAAGGATRFGGGGPHDRRPQVKPGTEGFWINNFRIRYLLWSGDSTSGFDQPLRHSIPIYR
jgi:hypothetical protein